MSVVTRCIDFSNGRSIRRRSVCDTSLPLAILVYSQFLKENSRKQWQNLLRKSDYNGDEQKLLRAVINTIREKIEASANVAIFLNKNRTITFEGETLQLIYVSGTELRGDEDFKKNIFSAVEEMSYSFHHDGKKVFAFRPDLSFFINGIFLGYAATVGRGLKTSSTMGRKDDMEIVPS